MGLRSIVLTVTAVVLAGTLSAAHAIDYSIRPLMRSGQVVPGHPELQIGTFSLGQGLAEDGSVSFSIYSYFAGTTPNTSAVGRYSESRGIEILGLNPTGVQILTGLSPLYPSIGPGGHVAFVEPIPNSLGAGILRVAAPGQPAVPRVTTPLTLPGVNLEVKGLGYPSPPSADGSATVYAYGNAGKAVIRAPDAGDTGVLMATLVGEPEQLDAGSLPFPLLSTGDRTALMTRTTSPTGTTSSLYVADLNGTALVAATGDPVIGFPNVTVPSFPKPLGVTDSGVLFHTVDGVFHATPGRNIQLVVRAGDPVANRAGAQVAYLDQFRVGTSVSGWSAYSGQILEQDAMLACVMVTEPDGTSRAVGVQGDPAPGTPYRFRGSLVSSLDSTPPYDVIPAISPDGFVLCRTYVYDPLLPSSAIPAVALFAPDGEGIVLAYVGGMFDFGDGTMKQVERVTYTGGATPEMFTLVNGSGDFAFMLGFTDGTYGSYRLTIPEPGRGMALVSAAALMFYRRHERTISETPQSTCPCRTRRSSARLWR